MKFSFYALTIVFVGVLGCTTKMNNSSIDTDITENEVRAFIAQYDQAWNTKDSIAVKKKLSDDYMYFNSVGGTNRKSETISFLRDTAYVVHSAKRSALEVIIHGNIATVNSHWIGELSWKGAAIHDNQRCGLTIAKTNGKIEIIAEHCVAITQDQ